jgi:queuine tRNA-ribosyltransferase
MNIRKTSGALRLRLMRLRELHRLNEVLGERLNSIHNLHYYQELMASMRAAIERGQFAEFVAGFHKARAGL